MCEGQVTRTEWPRHRPREAEAGAWLWNSQTHRDREGLKVLFLLCLLSKCSMCSRKVVKVVKVVKGQGSCLFQCLAS